MAATSTSISKMEAVRRALAALGQEAMPVKIQEYVQKSFNMEMTTAHVSNYKTAILRTKSKKGARPKAAAPASAAPVSVKAAAGTGVSIQDVETVKGLVGRVGEKNLKNLIDLFG